MTPFHHCITIFCHYDLQNYEKKFHSLVPVDALRLGAAFTALIMFAAPIQCVQDEQDGRVRAATERVRAQ